MQRPFEFIRKITVCLFFHFIISHSNHNVVAHSCFFYYIISLIAIHFYHLFSHSIIFFFFFSNLWNSTSTACIVLRIQKSIFYVEAKDPQKDILRLQQLETKWHEEAPSHVAAAAAAAANAAMAAADLNVSESISIAGLTTGTSTESLTGNGNTMANTI